MVKGLHCVTYCYIALPRARRGQNNTVRILFFGRRSSGQKAPDLPLTFAPTHRTRRCKIKRERIQKKKQSVRTGTSSQSIVHQYSLIFIALGRQAIRSRLLGQKLYSKIHPLTLTAIDKILLSDKSLRGVFIPSSFW